MAVAPTGAIYKAMTIDGESSRTYGVHITGQAVYNAPQREVEMISVPGRNGQLALDKGRFENIEVTYPAGIYADTEEEFAEAVSDFRNFLCSRDGYVRIEDEYNPNEYRMGIYKSGLEVETAGHKAGEFEIIFDCKPQRWLKSGEEAVTIGEWGETETATGSIVSIENDGTLGLKSVKVALDPIQGGSGTPSPDNVRPISGRTEVVTQRTGKNLCGISSSASATYTSNGITWTKVDDNTIHVQGTASAQSVCALTSDWSKLAHAYLPSGTYRASTDADVNLRIGVGASNTNKGNAKGGFAVTLDTDADVWIGLFVTSGTTINKDIHIQLEQGTTATTYEPYQGNTYTTALGRTVYGGTLDVVSGELVVDRAIVDLGSLTWTKINTQGSHWRFYATYNSAKNGGVLVSSQYAQITATEQYTGVQGVATQASGTNTLVMVSDERYSDATAFKTAMSGVQLVYELATPQTYQLTPQQVELLTGENNVWSDGGDVTLEYGQNPSVLVNPTLFESSPLLELEGYGSIDWGAGVITVNNATIGDVIVSRSKTWNGYSFSWDIDSSLANVGDPLMVEACSVSEQEVFTDSGAVNSYTYSTTGDPIVTTRTGYNSYMNIGTVYFTIKTKSLSFTYGTPGTETCTLSCSCAVAGHGTQTFTATLTLTYDGAVTFTLSFSVVTSSALNYTFDAQFGYVKSGNVILTSSKPSLGNPLYIDLDVGEAYKYENGQAVSVNNGIILPADLPKLASGANTVTYDDTITDLKVIPRWWKV